MSDTSGRESVSAYIITKDEEANIARAIESVAWMDEVIVLDSGSSDRTVDIAASLGAKVHTAEFNGFALQKNRALDLCKCDWCLNIDADEEVSPELRYSIERVLDNTSEAVFDAYEVSRKNFYLGRWISHMGWYPEYRLRFSRRGKAGWGDSTIHESLDCKGQKGRLKGDLLHRPYRDLGEHIATIGRYTKIWAEREHAKGRRFRWIDILFRPPFKFLRMYVLKAGFLDGMAGLVASLMGACYVCMKYARLYEIESSNK